MKLALVVAGLALVAAKVDAGDVTESPFPIDKGVLFVETDIVRSSRDGNDDVHTTTTVYGETLIGYGVSHRVELQANLVPYARESVRSGSTNTTSTGGGNLALRANIGLLRTDGDTFGLSILPFTHLPVGYGHFHVDQFHGGIAVPVSWAIAKSWSLSATGLVEHIEAEAGSNHDWSVSTTVSLDFSVTKDLGAYLELTNVAESSDLDRWGSTANFGIVITLNDTVNFTAGLNLGLTEPAYDEEFFLRLSTLW